MFRPVHVRGEWFRLAKDDLEQLRDTCDVTYPASWSN